jgi:WhiB family redox-sensing transcriptional regulator
MGIEASVAFMEAAYRRRRPGEEAIEFLVGGVTKAADAGEVDVDIALQAQDDLFAGEIETLAAQQVGAALARLVRLAETLEPVLDPTDEPGADVPISVRKAADGKYNQLLGILAETNLPGGEVPSEGGASTIAALGSAAVVGDHVFRLDPRNKTILPAFEQLGVDLGAECDNRVAYIHRAMTTLDESFEEDEILYGHDFLLAYLTGQTWPEIGKAVDIPHGTVRRWVDTYLKRLEHLQLTPAEWDDLANGIRLDLSEEVKNRVLNRHPPLGARKKAVETPRPESVEFRPSSRARVVYLDAIQEEALARPLAAGDEKDLSWQQRGLCMQTDPEAFFPDKGGSTREAKRVCVGCEVREVCLKYALDNDERFGIWGGLSERERRKLKKRAV